MPNFAPIFRGEGVVIEKKLSISFRKYISRAIQIWNQIFKIFSSCVGYQHLKNVTVKGYFPIFGPFFPFFGKMRILPKNSFRGILYPLMPSNFMQNIKKNLMSKFWAIYKKVDFVQLLRPLLLLFTLFRGKNTFLQKNDIIILNVLWYSIFMQKIIKNSWMVQKI